MKLDSLSRLSADARNEMSVRIGAVMADYFGFEPEAVIVMVDPVRKEIYSVACGGKEIQRTRREAEMAVRYSWPVDILVSVTEPPSPQRRGLRYPAPAREVAP